MIRRPGVVEAEEAARLFIVYHKTNDIPDGYVPRPVEGHNSNFGIIDLRGKTA